MTQMTGRIGDYSYDKFLGEGSFGKVYKGQNNLNKDEVAIKQMEMAKLSDPYMMDSLEQEINVMKALQSPNIVKLYDVIKESQYTYIILELCPQGDLDKYIEKEGGMLKEKVAIDILKQLMQGFKELASHNYIHRDIKPANCLIKDNIFKIADFGFACEADIKGKTLIKECVGTPLFMAPQLLENIPYTAKSDIWSIGMMFFLMIFGGTPWAARDPKSFLDSMKRYPLKFPYDKPIAQDTKNFIQRCLTIDENSRIGWEEIFKHPLLLEQHEDKEVDHHHIKLDAIAKKLMAKLQQMIHINNLQPRQLFKKFDQDYGGTLDQSEFYQMLLSIDPQITFKESVNIFQQIDSSNDGKISIQEFNDIISDFDFHELKDRAGRLINDLKDIIRANNYDLKQLFQKYDTDKSNLLDINEFTKLMKDLAPGLKPNEVQLIFNKLDQNGDSTIIFDEFQKTLQFGLQEIQQTDILQKEKAMKVVKELKAIIRIHKLDINEIFRSYDKDQNGKLDQEEFFKLIMTIDPNAHIEDVQSVFDIFNDHQKFVSMTDFYSHLC